MRGMSRFFGVAAVLAFSAMALPLHAQTPPPAQGQQNRIALVIGNGNYQSAPLATAANDAGLIAQTLQAAGFDVVGARDLDGASRLLHVDLHTHTYFRARVGKGSRGSRVRA